MTDAPHASVPLSLDKGPPVSDDAVRRRKAMSGWRRRSRLIHWLRRALPVAITIMLLGLIVAVIAAAVMSRSGEDEDPGETIRMTNPRFLGRDADNQAFVITAREAARLTNQNTRIRLIEPVIVLNSEGEARTRVAAEQGLYDETSKVLRLETGVKMQGSNGFNFTTEEAVVDTLAKTVIGSRPIQGQGPTGRIAADRYAFYDNGARVTFDGRVSARLERGPDARRRAAVPPAEVAPARAKPTLGQGETR